MAFGLTRWATRKLKSGDLTALAAIADGAAKPADTCLDRLAARHFIVKRTDGEIAVTLQGHVALMIRKKRAN